MKSAGLLGTAILITVISACSAGRQSPPRAVSPESRTPEVYDRIGRMKDDIKAYWMQIREWRVEEMGLRADPPRQFMATSVFSSSIKKLRVCDGEEAPRTKTCGDVCQYRDAICDNAEKICALAEELGDDWATRKCNSAKASCREARDRCCGCLASEPDTTPESENGGAW